MRVDAVSTDDILGDEVVIKKKKKSESQTKPEVKINKEKTKSKGGRPKLAESKSKRVTANFTDSEHDQIAELINGTLYTVSTYVREATLEKLARDKGQ